MIDLTCRQHPLVFHDHYNGVKRMRCTSCGGIGVLRAFLGPTCPGPVPVVSVEPMEVAWPVDVVASALVLAMKPEGPAHTAGAPTPEMEAAPVETTGAAVPSRVCSTHEDRTPEE